MGSVSVAPKTRTNRVTVTFTSFLLLKKLFYSFRKQVIDSTTRPGKSFILIGLFCHNLLVDTSWLPVPFPCPLFFLPATLPSPGVHLHLFQVRSITTPLHRRPLAYNFLALTLGKRLLTENPAAWGPRSTQLAADGCT